MSNAQAVSTDTIPAGSLGLRGLWALVGNSTALVIVAVVMFLAIFQVGRMHEEGMSVLKDLHREERDFNRAVHERMGAIVDKNSTAIDALAAELRRSRLKSETKD